MTRSLLSPRSSLSLLRSFTESPLSFVWPCVMGGGEDRAWGFRWGWLGEGYLPRKEMTRLQG